MALFAPWELSRRLLTTIAVDFAITWTGATAGQLAMRQIRLVEVPPHGILWTAFLLALLWVISLYFHDFYAPHRIRGPFRLVVDLMSATVMTSALVAALVFLVPQLNLGRRFYGAALFLDTSGLIAWRLVLNSLLARRLVNRVMVIGHGERARVIINEIQRHAHLGYQLVDLAADSMALSLAAAASAAGTGEVLTVGTLSQMEVLRSQVRTVVLTDLETSPIPVKDLLLWRMCGIEIVDFESFYERLTGRLPLAHLRESWLIVAPGVLRSTSREYLKRLVDIIVALVGLVVTSPIALLVAIAIKVDSPGPVIYRQKRVGQGGKIFNMYKFRSMYHDAEKLSGPVWAKMRDPRVTRVGRVIRLLRLDELPQLINVLKGDLSIVGPRPERPEIVPRLAQEIRFYELRHVVKPGLTGWAQICYPYGASIRDAEEKLSYDLYYVKNRSLIFDLQIILQTFKVVLFGRGAR